MATEQRLRTTSYLVIQPVAGERRIIVWDTVDISVGRSDSQDIVVAESEVSREHALFRRRGNVCEVEDLKSGLGTLVDGAPVKVHALQHGNVIKIGTLEIAFGQTSEPLARGRNVRFASELKEFGLSALEDGAGRTMLGFDAEDDLRPASASASASVPRAVTLDGAVEIDGPDSAPFDLGAGEIEPRGLGAEVIQNRDHGAGEIRAREPDAEAIRTRNLDLGVEDVPVRNLDLDLAGDISALDESAIARELAITRQSRQSHSNRAGDPREAAESPVARASLKHGASPCAAAAETTVKLVLEVKGPAAQVEAFLDAVRDKRIQLPPLELLVRDI